MRTSAIVLSILLAFVTDSMAQTYTQYGNTIYGSDGSTYSQYGNTTYDNQGNSWSTYGNTTYGPGGSSPSYSANLADFCALATQLDGRKGAGHRTR